MAFRPHTASLVLHTYHNDRRQNSYACSTSCSARGPVVAELAAYSLPFLVEVAA